MSKFSLTRRDNPCVVCDDSSGKCRQHRDGEIHLCMVYADSRLGDIQNGYKCIKADSGKGWSTWKIDNSKEWSEQQREEWQRLNQQRRLSQAKEDDERRRRSLAVTQRHEQYTQLLAELTLHPDDRTDLVRRGFSHQQIELAGVKSVESYHKLQSNFNTLLPGIGATGKELIVKHGGYLCPIRNADGLIVACQVRLRALPTGESNRYRWLSGKGQTLHLYPEECVEGELPLAVFRPEGKPERIALAEGTGAKPFLVSQRLNQIVIGAAGGQWISSEITFKRTLNQLSTELGGTEIILYPDAGDVCNQNVMSRWRRVVALLNKWGWSAKFGWWEQFTKDSPDIDEVEDFSLIRYILPDEFWQLAKQAAQRAEKEEAERQYWAQVEAEDAIYERLTTIQEKPWKVINTPKINLEELLIEPGTIYIVSSAKGTHKTNALVPVVSNHDRVLAWFNRVALGREECNRIGIVWKDDATGFSNKHKRGFCADSSFQFDPKILSDRGLLVGDECDQVFAHMFGSTCNQDGKRPLILATLEAHIDAAIYGGGMALFMSADVTQREIDYIKALAPKGCPVRLIVNEYKPERGTVFFDISDKPDGKIETLLATLEEGIPCFVIDDIKNGVRGCKSIAEYIRSVHPEWAGEIVEINSDTSGDPLIIDYLKNINEASKKTRLLCCSPSVISGVSIENGHFKGVFGLLNGILTVSEASQAIARVRGADKIHIWAAESGLAYEANRATDPEEIRAWYRRNYEANCRHLLSFKADYQPMTGEWSSPHFDLFCKNAAYRNLCMSRLRERLQTRLEEEGYKLVIEEDEGSDMVKEALKQGWNKIELAEARAIAAANILSDAELEALHYRTTPLNPEEKLDLQKTLLYKWFGQELIDATVHEHDSGEILTGYAAMALKNERGVYRQQLENFYLLASDEGEAVNKDVTAEAKQLRHSQGRFPGDIRWHTRQRKAREWLGLNQFLNPDKWWEPKDYAATCQKAKSKAPMVKDCLNLGVDKISDGQVFGELMRQLALELDKEWATLKPGQRRFKRRRISAESWNYAQMYVTYQEMLRVEREAIKAEVEAAEAQVYDTECANLITPPSIYIEPSFFGGGDQDLSQVEQVEMLTQKLDGSIEVRPEVSQVGTCDSECASLITPPSIYIEPSFLGGGDQDLSQELGEDLGGVTDLINPVESLLITLPVCENIDQLATLVENYSSEVVEEAIALADSQPRRRQLADWYQQLAQQSVGRGAELAQEDAIANPPLESYSEGDQVWFYHPSAEAKWIRGVVEWVRDRMVRVKAGFLGRLIENPHQIAPADWVLSGG